ncbi:MAG TPA: hypothetical protein VGC98_06580 [Thermoleophilaceae bacterium]|jgi:hypothetical protein
MPYESEIPGVRWLNENWLGLVPEHRFQWLVAGAEGLLAAGEDLELVIAQAAETDESWSQIAFAFVDGQELEPHQELEGLSNT